MVEAGLSWDRTHSEKFGKKFCSEQRVIGGPKFGGARNKTLVVDAQLLGDFGTRYHFLEGLIPFWVRGLRVEISFDLGRGEGSEDESDDLALDEVKVNGRRKTQMAVPSQIQELHVDLGNGNTIGHALRDVPQVE